MFDIMSNFNRHHWKKPQKRNKARQAWLHEQSQALPGNLATCNANSESFNAVKFGCNYPALVAAFSIL